MNFAKPSRLTAVAMLLLVSAADAQFVAMSADFSPDVAVPGRPINFTLYNASGQTWNTGACDWFTIYRSDPATGQPITSEWIEHTLVCTDPPRVTPPRCSIEWEWDQLDHCPACGLTIPSPPYPAPAAVAPGRYWFHAHPAGFSEWYCFTIQAPTAPQIVATSPARIGRTARFAVSAPADGGSTFGAFLSFSQDQAIGVVPGFGIDICLGPPLYTVGIPAALDAAGHGTLQLSIPPRPALVDFGFHLQVFLLHPANLALKETNAISVPIRP